jgi:Ran GTPase-activating protein (RanGAP) involved in mRNA processing and transport
VVQQAVINKQCTRLRLSDNKITSQGVSVLAEALHDNTILEGLYIFNNHVADKGVYSLAQVLSENKSALQTLSIGWNEITDEGANYLAEMLKTNTTLIELWLPWNRISDQGVQLLAKALIHHNTSLKRLSLDLNKLVSDLSVDFLVDVLNHNQSLTALHVRDCKLSKAGKEKLHEVEKSNKNIELNL